LMDWSLTCSSTVNTLVTAPFWIIASSFSSLLDFHLLSSRSLHHLKFSSGSDSWWSLSLDKSLVISCLPVVFKPID
jgi:hypothetical protein